MALRCLTPAWQCFIKWFFKQNLWSASGVVTRDRSRSNVRFREQHCFGAPAKAKAPLIHFCEPLERIRGVARRRQKQPARLVLGNHNMQESETDSLPIRLPDRQCFSSIM